jgi:hypothetical protein
MREWKWTMENANTLTYVLDVYEDRDSSVFEVATKLQAALAELQRREAALYILHDGRCWKCNEPRSIQVEDECANVGVTLFATPPTPAPAAYTGGTEDYRTASRRISPDPRLPDDDEPDEPAAALEHGKCSTCDGPGVAEAGPFGADGFERCPECEPEPAAEPMDLEAILEECTQLGEENRQRRERLGLPPAAEPTDTERPIALPVRTERVGHLLALFDASGACIIRREDAAIVEQIADALNAQAKR